MSKIPVWAIHNRKPEPKGKSLALTSQMNLNPPFSCVAVGHGDNDHFS